MEIVTALDGWDVALDEGPIGGHASERAVDSIPQTRPQRNPPLRGVPAEQFAQAAGIGPW